MKLNPLYEIKDGKAVPRGSMADFQLKRQGKDYEKPDKYLPNMPGAANDPLPTTVWKPFEGTSQERFLACNSRFILYGGTRGPGKTDAAIMKFAKYCGRGYGAAWRGVIFSTRYKNLDDVKQKGKRWFFALGIGVRFIESKDAYKFVWPTGEELLLRICEKEDDYWNYHGHEYPFVLFEELTKWQDDKLYHALRSVNRCSVAGVPKFYIATTNPYGSGHHWVKELWVDPNPGLSSMGTLLPAFGEGMEARVRFDGDILENKFIVENDPEYILSLDNIPNEELKRAWRYGNWDINVGAFFHGYLTKERNMIKPFMPPASWTRWKAYDWGSRRPFSVGYYAQDPEGVIYRYRELYGWSGKPNEGNGMTYGETCDWMDEAEAYEKKSGLMWVNNPADDSLWANDGREKSLAQEFAMRGHIWSKAKKNLWGRVRRWELMKELFKTGGLLITSDCTSFWRTMPNLMADDNNWEDIDTDMEDHIADECGYSVTSRHMSRINKGDFSKSKTDTSGLGGASAKHQHLLPGVSAHEKK